MSESGLQWVAGTLVTLWLTAVSWIVNKLSQDIEKNERETLEARSALANHKLHAAETFATMQRVEGMERRILEKLDKLTDKINETA